MHPKETRKGRSGHHHLKDELLFFCRQSLEVARAGQGGDLARDAAAGLQATPATFT